MRTVGYYLKENWKPVAVYAGMAAVFWTVGSLYGVDPDATGYALLLAGVILLLSLCPGFFRFLRKERELRETGRNIAGADPVFPAAGTLAEKRYQEMIGTLLEQRNQERSVVQQTRQDSLDYYSLWAHQIKTPIAAMRLLLQEEEGRRQGKDGFLRGMDRELFRTEQYVEMVLNYLRIGDMSRDMVLAWHPLDDMIRQAVRKYSRLFIIQKLRLDFRETGATVLTDEKWLVFVLEQILSNALKYTKEGSVSIYAGPSKENGAVLVIEDTGIGIAKEDLPRVCERGFTGYNGRAYKKSTGIGLYLCRSVMDHLGHGLRIESEEGKGTKVLLVLGRTPVEPE